MSLMPDALRRARAYSHLGWAVRKELLDLNQRGIAPLIRVGMCAPGTGGYPMMHRWVQDVDL